MIQLQENVDLFPFNTFGMHANARYFVTVTSLADVLEVFRGELSRKHPRLILGGGSNILLTRDVEGLVILNQIRGIDTVEENDERIVLKVGSGENWHRFVTYCVEHDYGGVENLSLIPGTVGAAPMQNIGAYGVEVRDVIRSVEAVEMETGAVKNFSRDACSFGYRESVFKHELKDRYFISSVTLSLTKKNHRLNTGYGAIQQVLAERKVAQPDIRAISDAVIHIRRSKLPDPALIGNAGSFFKNPSISASHFEALKQAHPGIPGFPGEDGHVKVPAAWLIEQCGWKGKTFDNIGVHKNQALVLVNYGGGEGKKIWQLAMQIQSSVKDRFDITLQPEVNVL